VGLMNRKALLVMIGALNFGLDMFNEKTNLLKFGSYVSGCDELEYSSINVWSF
jgi:hypothetical protein